MERRREETGRPGGTAGSASESYGPDEEVVLIGVTTDELEAIRAAVVLAQEALVDALASIARHEGPESGLAREVGSALEALATTEGDIRQLADGGVGPDAED